jgi:hypothetical protein
MPKVWNLGNTTVRNPNRIEEGLKLFSDEFQGSIHGSEAEARFWNRLVEEGIVISSNTEQAWGGRKWRNVLVKLGFATDSGYKINKQSFTPHDLATQHPELGLEGLDYEITPSGNHLLDASSSIGAVHDVYLRQLVRHEIPSPIEGNFPPGRLKPFVLILQILAKLREANQPGLTKLETGIFLQLFRCHTEELVDSLVERIVSYRRERDLITDQAGKKRLDNRLLFISGEEGEIAPTSLTDYADTTFRYSQMSGVVASQGLRLVLREDKIEIIDAILHSEPVFQAQSDPLGYLADFYQGTALPTDNVQFAHREIHRLQSIIQSYRVIPRISEDDISNLTDIHGVELARYTLLDQIGTLKEEQFAIDQSSPSAINEILGYLDALNNPRRRTELIITDPPSYLEWAIWRSFLAIDNFRNTIQSSRRFTIDDDLLPRNHAPGGGSDMVFEFDQFILAVEVTLIGSSVQLVKEGEPVKRHIADLRITYPDKDIYGLFIAPYIDNNIAEAFRIGVWYRDENEEYVNVVPMTLGGFKQIISVLLKSRFSPVDLKFLLDRCLTHRNIKAPEWKRQIETEAEKWMLQVNTPT